MHDSSQTWSSAWAHISPLYMFDSSFSKSSFIAVKKREKAKVLCPTAPWVATWTSQLPATHCIAWVRQQRQRRQRRRRRRLRGPSTARGEGGESVRGGGGGVGGRAAACVTTRLCAGSSRQNISPSTAGQPPAPEPRAPSPERAACHPSLPRPTCARPSNTSWQHVHACRYAQLKVMRCHAAQCISLYAELPTRKPLLPCRVVPQLDHRSWNRRILW